MLSDYEMLTVAYEQAALSRTTGGIPIGAALFGAEGQLLSVGHNQRCQHDDPVLHAEVDAFRRAGRQKDYRSMTMVTTLAPCWLCSGMIRQFNIGSLIIGENQNFQGGEEWLKNNGHAVRILNDERCIDMMRDFIRSEPELWFEDIGEVPEA